MARPLKIRKPTLAEFRRLSRQAVESETPRQQRRANALVLHYTGMSVQDIAAALGVHPNTIYSDLRAFGQLGLASIGQHAPMGTPPRLGSEQAQQLARLAETAPSELGLPWGRWSLSTLRAYAIQQRIVRRISRERLRQVLQKKGSICAASSAR
jgi:transposase